MNNVVFVIIGIALIGIGFINLYQIHQNKAKRTSFNMIIMFLFFIFGILEILFGFNFIWRFESLFNAMGNVSNPI